jgi:hypothetical protein
MSVSAIIVLMMEAVRASEMSVYFNETTRHYIPEVVIFVYGSVPSAISFFCGKHV